MNVTKAPLRRPKPGEPLNTLTGKPFKSDVGVGINGGRSVPVGEMIGAYRWIRKHFAGFDASRQNDLMFQVLAKNGYENPTEADMNALDYYLEKGLNTHCTLEFPHPDTLTF